MPCAIERACAMVASVIAVGTIIIIMKTVLITIIVITIIMTIITTII